MGGDGCSASVKCLRRGKHTPQSDDFTDCSCRRQFQSMGGRNSRLGHYLSVILEARGSNPSLNCHSWWKKHLTPHGSNVTNTTCVGFWRKASAKCAVIYYMKAVKQQHTVLLITHKLSMICWTNMRPSKHI